MAAYARPRVGASGWCDWIQPIRTGYRMSCCDCGLVHEMAFRVYRCRVQFRARRNARATAAVRRERKKGSR